MWSLPIGRTLFDDDNGFVILFISIELGHVSFFRK